MKWIKVSERIWEYGKPTIVRYDGKVYMETAHNVIYCLPKEEIEWLDESQASDKDKEIEEEKDRFAISFACWLKGAEGQMYEATGMSAQALLDKYKDRPFINTFDTDKQ